MELLLLLLLVPIFWLLRLPSRLASMVRRHRLAVAGIVTILALGGVTVLQLSRPTAETPVDYAMGDTALRALLE
jgi:hypothetical protein